MRRPAARLVARAMALTTPQGRVALLTDLLRHAAAALVVILGPKGASEALYALADDVSTRED